MLEEMLASCGVRGYVYGAWKTCELLAGHDGYHEQYVPEVNGVTGLNLTAQWVSREPITDILHDVETRLGILPEETT